MDKNSYVVTVFDKWLYQRETISPVFTSKSAAAWWLYMNCGLYDYDLIFTIRPCKN